MDASAFPHAVSPLPIIKTIFLHLNRPELDYFITLKRSFDHLLVSSRLAFNHYSGRHVGRFIFYNMVLIGVL